MDLVSIRGLIPLNVSDMMPARSLGAGRGVGVVRAIVATLLDAPLKFPGTSGRI